MPANEAKDQDTQKRLHGRAHERVEVATHYLDGEEFLITVDLPRSAKPLAHARREWIARVLRPDVVNLYVGARTIRAVFDSHAPSYAANAAGYVVKIAGVSE